MNNEKIYTKEDLENRVSEAIKGTLGRLDLGKKQHVEGFEITKPKRPPMRYKREFDNKEYLVRSKESIETYSSSGSYEGCKSVDSDRKDWIFIWSRRDGKVRRLITENRLLPEAEIIAANYGWSPKRWWQWWRRSDRIYYNSF